MNDQISIPAGNAKTEELKFISLEEAAAMTSGTRVTFIPGVQAMYAEALKNICFVKKNSLDQSDTPYDGYRRIYRPRQTGQAVRIDKPNQSPNHVSQRGAPPKCVDRATGFS